jgi:DNA-binding CsgD family transcriptional regulator
MAVENIEHRQPLFCLDGKPHCFHPNPERHDILAPAGIHVDEKCCWCGIASCRNVPEGKRDGHGEYAPENENEVNASEAALRVYNKLAKPFQKNPLIRKNALLLKMLASGITEKDVAKKWGVTVRAVTYRQARIKKKLGVKTTIEAVAVAIRNRFIE